MTGSGRPGGGIPADIRTDVAHPARVYDYWLGGKDNFGADRAAARRCCGRCRSTGHRARQSPVHGARGGILARCRDRQFLDIGSGLPSSPNVHEIAQGETTVRAWCT